MTDYIVFQTARGEAIYVFPATECRLVLDKKLRWVVNSDLKMTGVEFIVDEDLGGSLLAVGSMREATDHAIRLGSRK